MLCSRVLPRTHVNDRTFTVHLSSLRSKEYSKGKGKALHLAFVSCVAQVFSQLGPFDNYLSDIWGKPELKDVPTLIGSGACFIFKFN